MPPSPFLLGFSSPAPVDTGGAKAEEQPLVGRRQCRCPPGEGSSRADGQGGLSLGFLRKCHLPGQRWVCSFPPGGLSPSARFTPRLDLSVVTSLPPWGSAAPRGMSPSPCFSCCGRTCSPENTRAQQPPILKVRTLFWPHTWVFCVYCILVSWRSLTSS